MGNFNMMELIQLMNMAQSSKNPQQFLMQQLGNNPMFQRAIQMTQGKNEQEIQQTAINMANQMGIDRNTLSQFASQFGIKM